MTHCIAASEQRSSVEGRVVLVKRQKGKKEGKERSPGKNKGVGGKKGGLSAWQSWGGGWEQEGGEREEG